MISEEQLFDFLNQYDAPTADWLGLDYKSVSSLITSNTNLNLLTLIAKAEKQGLDLIYVDNNKFYNADYESKSVEWADGEPWQGARYVSVNLSFILIDGHSFAYKGILEGMGYDWELNTRNMVGEALEYFGIDDNLDWLDAPIVTVADLLSYLNGGLRVVPVKKSIPRTNWFSDSSIVFLLGILLYIPYQLIVIPVYNYFRGLIHEQNKPLGYKRTNNEL